MEVHGAVPLRRSCERPGVWQVLYEEAGLGMDKSGVVHMMLGMMPI
jgi:hypothetical protein